MREYKWLPIDTPSIMFSAISSAIWGRTIRMAVVFKEHTIQEGILRQAVADLQNRFPVYFSYLKRGFFWNYLQQTDAMPEIRPEDGKALHPIVLHKDEKPDFRIVYSGRRLAFECAHYITDGHGLQAFLLALVQRYMILAGLTEDAEQDGILYWKDSADAGEWEDSFLKYGDNEQEKAKSVNQAVWHFDLACEKDALYLTYFLMNVSEIKEKSAALGVTLTEYLTAAYMLAIIRTAKNKIEKPVCVDIPVNLRRFFETATLRSFVYQVSTVLDTEGRQDWTLTEIAAKIKGQVASQVNQQALQSILKKLTGLAKNPVVRLIPNFIKLPVLRVLQKRSHANQSTIFTNLGNVSLPQEIAQHIERLELVNGDTRGYGLPATCSGVSFNGQFVFCISSNSGENAVWKELASILTAEGLAVRVECSYADKKKEEQTKVGHTLCESCGVLLPTDYAVCPLCGKMPVHTDNNAFTSVPVAYPAAQCHAEKYENKEKVQYDIKGRLQAYFHF